MGESGARSPPPHPPPLPLPAAAPRLPLTTPFTSPAGQLSHPHTPTYPALTTPSSSPLSEEIFPGRSENPRRWGYLVTHDDT